ncbi:MAG: trypsin-like peptidase domain-containing protein [Planctomycetota bacterium]|nr:trypsin-like peptidase domain-containing protein [Planctomycetota bacterium]
MRYLPLFVFLPSMLFDLAPSTAEGHNTILLYFGSSHCSPCKLMKPRIRALELEGTPVRQIDVLQEPYFASRYGVRQTPTFIVISGQKELTRLVGPQSVVQLRRAIANDSPNAIVPTWSKGKEHPSGNLSSHHQFGSASAIPLRSNNADSFSTGGERVVTANSVVSLSEAMPNQRMADSIERARAATVRLRIHDPDGHSTGTGTIIDARDGEVLVLTCGHLFREAGVDSEIEVDVFRGGQCVTLPGRLIDFDPQIHDIGLVGIRTEIAFQPIRLRSDSHHARNGETVFSFGCDRGSLPTRRDTRITGVNKYNQHLGLTNYEIEGAPIDGRSGGGLFDQQGFLIGVCNAADYRDNVGIYAGLTSIGKQLKRIGMASLISQD